MNHQTTEKQKASKALVAFKHNIEPMKLLALLDELILGLEREPTPENAGIALKSLSRYQIITLEHGGEPRWLTAPADIQMEVIDHPMHKRILRLLKTGDWMDAQSERTKVKIHSASAIPIKVPMDASNRSDVLEETVSSNARWLLLSLRTLHTIIRLEAENGPVGVFERPYGVTNMNRIHNYLDKMGGNIREMGGNMRVHELDTVVQNAVYTVNA